MQFISIFLRFPPEDTFIDFFRERGSGGEEREKERGRETSTWEGNIDWLPPKCSTTRDRTHNLGMCPEREMNLQSFCVRDNIPTNWAPGQSSSVIFLIYFKVTHSLAIISFLSFCLFLSSNFFLVTHSSCHCTGVARSKYPAYASLFVIKHRGDIWKLEENREGLAATTFVRKIQLETIQICWLQLRNNNNFFVFLILLIF